MHRHHVTVAVLCLVVPILAVACVTITPAKVATAPSPEVTLGAPTPPPTATPTAEPTATSTPTQGTSGGKPVKTPKPNKTVEPTSEPTATPTGDPTAEPGPTANPDDPACFDDSYTLEGFSWDAPFEWRYNASSTPAGFDPDAVVAVIQAGFDNMLNEVNDCGRPKQIAVQATYGGTTVGAACAGQIGDGFNEVAWGHIPNGLDEDTIAFTCPYNLESTGEIAEADIVISYDVDWALSEDDCTFEELLEPTITHEVGHVLGLGHVSERSHGALTMSTRSNGPCSNDESSLGLGDMLGLEKLYPSGE